MSQNLRKAEDAAAGDEYALKKSLETHSELDVLFKDNMDAARGDEPPATTEDPLAAMIAVVPEPEPCFKRPLAELDELVPGPDAELEPTEDIPDPAADVAVVQVADEELAAKELEHFPGGVPGVVGELGPADVEAEAEETEPTQEQVSEEEPLVAVAPEPEPCFERPQADLDELVAGPDAPKEVDADLEPAAAIL